MEEEGQEAVEGVQPAVAQQQHVSLEVRVGRVAVQLRSEVRTPLLELGAQAIKLGLGTQAEGVLRGFLFASVSCWHYRPLLAAWEPVVEPWQLLLHLDRNLRGHQCAGVAPGTWLRLTSTQGSVSVTLSSAALGVLLTAAREWSTALLPTPPPALPLATHTAPGARLPAGAAEAGREGEGAEGGRMAELLQLAQSEAGSVPTQVHNALGQAVQMLVEHEVYQEVLDLAPGQQRRFLMPLPLPPPGPLTSSRREAGLGVPLHSVGQRQPIGSQGGALEEGGPVALPQLRLVVDVMGVQAQAWHASMAAVAGAAQGGDVLCRIQVGGPVAELLGEGWGWGLTTRALPLGPPPSLPPSTPPTPPTTQPHPSSLPPGVPPPHPFSPPSPPPPPLTSSPPCWGERFLIQLPLALTEQLLLLQGGTAQWTATPLTLHFQLVSPHLPTTQREGGGARGGPMPGTQGGVGAEAAGEAGEKLGDVAKLGHVLAAGSLAVDMDWLTNQARMLQAASLALRPTPRPTHPAVPPSPLRPATPPQPPSAPPRWEAWVCLTPTPPPLARPPPHPAAPWVPPHAPPPPPPFTDLLLPEEPAAAASASPPTSPDPPVGPPAPLPLQLQVRLSLAAQQAKWGGELVGEPRGGRAAAGRRGPGGGLLTQGTRALRVLPGQRWVGFTLKTAQQQAAGSRLGAAAPALGTVVVPLLLPGPPGCRPLGLALENSASPGGGRREVLRSLACLTNATSLVMEVSLMSGADSSGWTLVPPAPPAGPRGPAAPSPQEESSGVTARGGRLRYNTGRSSGGDVATFPLIDLPPVRALTHYDAGHPNWPAGKQVVAERWEWDGPWEIEADGYVDNNGWAYGATWRILKPAASLDGAETSPSTEPETMKRLSLGLLAPGARLPLPLGWAADGCELQVRPILQDPRASLTGGEPCAGPAQGVVHGPASHALAGQQPAMLQACDGSSPLHAWSLSGSSGQAGIRLSELQDGATRLVCCEADVRGAAAVLSQAVTPSSEVDVEQVAAADVALASAVQSHWVSVTEECDPLIASGASAPDVLLDWRLTLRPPLILHNTLPTLANFILWERCATSNSGQAAVRTQTAPGMTSMPRAGTGPSGMARSDSIGVLGSGPLRCRQQGKLGPGSTLPIYTVDMRQQLFLSWWPEGCEWGEPEPLLISEGINTRALAGVAGSARLPDSFRCTYTSTTATAPLRLHISRDLDFSAACDPSHAPSSASGFASSPAAFSLTRMDSDARPSSSASSAASLSNVSAAGLAHESSNQGLGSRSAPLTRLPLALALARGCPLTVRVHAPLTVVNATDVPVSVGVLVLEGEGDEGSPLHSAAFSATFSSSSGASSGGQEVHGVPGASAARGVGGMGLVLDSGQPPLRVLDTEAGLGLRPPGQVTVLPGALELVSLPPLSTLDDDLPGGPVLAVGISCGGSRWCAPLPLPRAPLSAAAAAAAQGRGGDRGGAEGAAAAAAVAAAAAAGSRTSTSPALQQPILLRAHSRAGGPVYEIVARFEPLATLLGGAARGGAQGQAWVLRLDVHLVVDNRSGVDMRLLRPEASLAPAARPAHLAWAALARQTSPLEKGVGGNTGGQGIPLQHLDPAHPPLTPAPATLPLPTATTSLPLHWPPGCAERLLALALVPPSPSATSSPLRGPAPATPPSAPVTTHEGPAHHNSPSSFSPAADPSSSSEPRTHPPSPSPAAAMQAASLTTSRFQLDSLPLGEPVQLLLPLVQLPLLATGSAVDLKQAGEAAAAHLLAAAGASTAAAAAAAAAAAGALQQQQQWEEGSQIGSGQDGGVARRANPHELQTAARYQPHLVRVMQLEPAGSAPDLNLAQIAGHGAGLAAGVPVGAWRMVEVVGVGITLTLQPRGPGCFRLVIGALGEAPAHVLHNATPHALQFREKCDEAAPVTFAWQQLPPFSALGFLRQGLANSREPAMRTSASDISLHRRSRSGSHVAASRLDVGPGGGSGDRGSGRASAASRAGPGATGSGTRQRVIGSGLAPLKLEVRDASTSVSSAAAPQAQGPTEWVCLDADEGSTAAQAGGEAAAATASTPAAAASGLGGMQLPRQAYLRLGPARIDCMLQVCEAPQGLTLGPGGLARVASAAPPSSSSPPAATIQVLGQRGGRTAVLLRVTPRPPTQLYGAGGASGGVGGSQARHWVVAGDVAAATASGVAAGLHFILEVSGCEVSLVDGLPQELALLSLEGLGLEVHWGITAGLAHTQLALRCRSLQVDDQMFGTPHPVVLLPQEGPTAEPLLALSIVCIPHKRRGAVRYPCIAARVLPLRVALGEALLWRLISWVACLANSTAATDSPPQPGSVTSSQEGGAMELPWDLGLLAIENVVLCLSFKADAAARPRFANQVLSFGLNLVNLEELPLELPGLELERVCVLRSALLQLATSQLQDRVFSIGMAVLRNYGIIGSTSKARLSKGLSKGFVQGVASLAEGAAAATRTTPSSSSGSAQGAPRGMAGRPGGADGAAGGSQTGAGGGVAVRREVGNIGEDTD
ncbi:hypothetical protein V8C86DRAFT_3121422 [Haematococcus lacustris]